ncbi:hypothetical protein [Cocleimonas flava]|nr:hypothetical protein [Cocleimonas flava]
MKKQFLDKPISNTKNTKITTTVVKLMGGGLIAATMLGAVTGCSNGSGSTVVTAAAPAPYYYPYDYYYYPYSRVYFSISTGYYYYPDGTNWIKVRTLPPHFRLNPVNRVTVRLKTNQPPYRFHNVHRKQYVPRSRVRVDPRRDRIERNANLNRYKNYRRR